MPKVYMANQYRPNSLGSFDRTQYMLMRQFQFPYDYERGEEMMSADSDRLWSWDHEHTDRVFRERTGSGELSFEGWLHSASDENIMKFLIDVLKADVNIKWTGYRVMGSVHLGNGYVVWTFELFAKRPDSRTEVYTGGNAPNVESKPFHKNLDYMWGER